MELIFDCLNTVLTLGSKLLKFGFLFEHYILNFVF